MEQTEEESKASEIPLAETDPKTTDETDKSITENEKEEK